MTNAAGIQREGTNWAGIDWDDAFANGAYIDGAMDYLDRWASLAEAFRKEHPHKELDDSYGPHARNRLDLFRPSGSAQGLAVFVHGGYWLKFDKSWWSHLAQGALARGWAVVLPSYVLAPEARISDMTAQICAAIEKAAAMVGGPIHISGHSAGGHLVSRMASSTSPLSASVLARLKRVVSISGLHHLEPLQLTEMNKDLKLDGDEARAESAALLDPATGIETICWVGAQERPEFLRQNRLLEERWSRKGATISAVYDPGKHHFNVIDGLADPESLLTQAFVG